MELVTLCLQENTVFDFSRSPKGTHGIHILLNP